MKISCDNLHFKNKLILYMKIPCDNLHFALSEGVFKKMNKQPFVTKSE